MPSPKGGKTHMPQHEPAGPELASGMGPLITVSEVAALCRTPCGLEGYSPLLDHNYLLLNITGAGNRSGELSLQSLIDALRGLPCPVIAVGEPASPAVLKGVDVVVDSLRDAAPLIKNIDEHPLAAMTLVQLLRHNEEVTARQGLLAESLAYASLQSSVTKNNRADRDASPESEKVVLVERQEDALHLTLNRPQQRNAYSAQMRDALYEALLLLKMDTGLHRAVIRGEGSCFCIGGDLNEFGLVPNASIAHAIRSSRNVGRLLLELGSQLEFRLHRACIGAGMELPAFGARVVADSNTFVQLPEIKLGLLPGAGGTVSILRRIGRHRTAYLALSACRINAATALQWGLIDEIV
jgi:enoyl-CoA hydratase